jgi:phage FluMu protein Com
VLIHFRCPHCERLLAIGTHKGGAQINCPMCTHPVTVPPRTEVELPTTTVVLPDVASEWWMDAPAVAEPKEAALPSSPPPAREDAWWLTAEETTSKHQDQSPTG